MKTCLQKKKMKKLKKNVKNNEIMNDYNSVEMNMPNEKENITEDMRHFGNDRRQDMSSYTDGRLVILTIIILNTNLAYHMVPLIIGWKQNQHS